MVRLGAPERYVRVPRASFISKMILLVVVLTALAPLAEAAPSGEAEALYDSGHFLEAAKLAEARNTAEGLAFAARATLMHAGYMAEGEEALDELKKGEALARQAVAKDPEDVEGLLDLVVALGYLSREEGMMRAHEDGYGREAQKLLGKAIQLAPDDPWAEAAYGGWNAEIVARGGSFAASVVYGASRDKAIEAFDKAVMLDPDNPIIRVEYATALIRMRSKHPDLDAVRTQLAAALKVEPHTAADRILQAQGKKLMAAVEREPPEDLADVVKRMTPFEK